MKRIKKKTGLVDGLRQRTDPERNASGAMKRATAELFTETLVEMSREYDQCFIAYAFYGRGFLSLQGLTVGLVCGATEIQGTGDKVYEMMRAS